MDRIKVNANSEIKVSEVFENLQDFTKSSLVKRISTLIGNSYGVLYDVNGTELKATLNGDLTVTVNAGLGICKNGEIIEFTSPQTVAISSLGTLSTNTKYILALKFVSTGYAPATAANGFYYDSDGTTPYSTKYTKYRDSYSFVALTGLVGDVGTDVIPICYFTTKTTGPISINDSIGLEDCRPVIRIPKKLLSSSEVVFKDRNSTGSEKINGSLETSVSLIAPTINADDASKGTIIISSDSSSFNIEASDRLKIKPTETNKIIEIVDADENSLLVVDTANKKVGINTPPSSYTLDVDGDVNVTGTIKTAGKTVATTDFNVLAPSILYIRTDSITSTRSLDIFFNANGQYDGTDEDMRPLIATNYQNNTGWTSNTATSSELLVTLKWGYDSVVGVGIAGTNTYQLSAPIVNSGLLPDSLVGYYIYFKDRTDPVTGDGENLKIIADDGSGLLTLQYSDGRSWTNSGFSYSSKGVIHSNATLYVATATPIINGALKPERSVSQIVSTANDITVQEAKFKLKAGTKYRFAVYGISGYYRTEVIESSDILIRHPLISSTGASIGAATTASGFKVTITGWNDAEAFEICYTTDKSGADFTNQNHERIITSEKSKDIPTSSTENYQIKIRPLIGGQQVAAPLTTSVVSGHSGNLPQDQVLLSAYIDFDTYSGYVLDSVQAGPAGRYQISFVSIQRLSDEVMVNALPTSIIGELLVDHNNNAYRINALHNIDLGGGSYKTLLELVWVSPGSPVAPSTSNGASIGHESLARRIIRINKLTTDMVITRIDVDCDILRTKNSIPLTMRVYQEATPNKADMAQITNSDAAFTIDANTLITSTAGDRNVVVDLVDPTDINPWGYNGRQNPGFAGRVTVYARPWGGR